MFDGSLLKASSSKSSNKLSARSQSKKITRNTKNKLWLKRETRNPLGKRSSLAGFYSCTLQRGFITAKVRGNDKGDMYADPIHSVLQRGRAAPKQQPRFHMLLAIDQTKTTSDMTPKWAFVPRRKMRGSSLLVPSNRSTCHSRAGLSLMMIQPTEQMQGSTLQKP